jgi:glycosyltransferase involved in cell wall biosynthesis
MNVLIVSDRCSNFLRNYIRLFATALGASGAFPLVLAGESVSEHGLSTITTPAFSELASQLDEHRYLEAFRVARDYHADHVHFCFMTDPQRLYLALATDPEAHQLRFTYSIFGLAEYLRKPIYRQLHERLLAMDCVKRVLVHSIYPEVARSTAAKHGILQSAKVAYVHDPVYDDPGLFEVDQGTARAELGLPPDKRVALYFGTFSHKKGPDVLVAASRHLGARDQLRVVLAGNIRAAPAGLVPNPAAEDLPTNILVDDRFVDDVTMGRYFAAADLVVQPYRSEYEHDTSGVLVQAALAGRPVLAPDISPFRQTVQEFRLGTTFSCGDPVDLARRMDEALYEPRPASATSGTRYIQRIESWTALARLTLEQRKPRGRGAGRGYLSQHARIVHLARSNR